MRSVLYLFNGTGWGDHFLAIPFIKRHTEKYGKNSLLVVTYQKHIEPLFSNVEAHYIGLEKPDFCFNSIEKEILSFNPDRIICFNAFNGFDFDCHIQRLHGEIRYFGTYTQEGLSIRHPYKEFAHTRDQYFLLPVEDIDYTTEHRHLNFTPSEGSSYNEYFDTILQKFDRDSTIIVHLDSEPRKLWDPKSWFLTLRYLLDKGKKILFVGNNKDMINTYIKYLPEAGFIEEPDIRKVFWLVKSYKFFIGIDSVFAHIADAYELNGLILFSDYPVHEWKPVSNKITLLLPGTGKLTKDIGLEAVIKLLPQKFQII